VKPGSTSSPSRRVVPLETLRSARYASAARRRRSITQTSLTPAAPVGHLGAHPVARAPPVAHARAPSPCRGCLTLAGRGCMLLPAPTTRPDILRLGTNERVRCTLLECVRDPSAHAADREGWREQRDVESEPVQKERGVELHVRLETPVRLVLLEQRERRALHVTRQRVQPHVSCPREQPLGRRGEDIGAGIANLVHAMPEAHEPLPRLDLRSKHPL